MPFVFPQTPVPSSIHPPTILDPFHMFETDQSYSIRRAKHSRPRRIFQVDYLGLTTHDMRVLRHFIQFHRLGVTPFSWTSVTSVDTALVASTTPVTLSVSHEWVTGQWVWVSDAFHPSLNGAWRVTVPGINQVTLNGSTAVGTGTCHVYTFLPLAIAHLPDGVFEAPAKLFGPVSADTTRGRFNLQIAIEEVL